MTTQALLALIAFALLKGAPFGMLFAWIFPPLHCFFLGRMGHLAGPLRQVAFGSRLYWGLAVLAGTERTVRRLEDLRGRLGDEPDVWLAPFMAGRSAA